MSPELTAAVGEPADFPAADADDLVSLLDEANAQRAVVLSLAYVDGLPDDAAMKAENDYTAAEVAKHPDRLIGFCGIHPLRGLALDEIDRCIDELGMGGVKLHLADSKLDLRQAEHVDALSAVLDHVGERGVPVLMHAADPNGLPMDSDALHNLATLIATHPDVRFAFAHCGSYGPVDLDTLTAFLAALPGALPRQPVA